ncbi:MAG: c-type cytochrome [Planctomycetales bacterium]|nr:c-type cytochrome [Planctomycetales bacterium]
MSNRGWTILLIGAILLTGCRRPAQVKRASRPNGDSGQTELALSGEVVDGVRVVPVRAFSFDWAPNPVVIVAAESVKLVVRSDDTTHGIVIPDLEINEKLLPGQPVEIEFIAPEPGAYDFFCSVVCGWGHNSMTGYLLVLEEDGTGELGMAQPMPLREKPPQRQFVKDYRFEDLVPHLDWPDGSRSFESGQKLFVEMTCSKCHSMEGSDNLGGPNLARADLKLSRAELLREILEPSKRIDDKYRPWTFIADGRAIVGIILEHSDQHYLVQENLGEASAPIKIMSDDLEEEPSPAELSLMPAQLLSAMSIAEIQDLLAYVLAKGDPRHESYQGNTSGE